MDNTVQLKGNVSLVLHFMLYPQELNTLYSCSNTHIASKCKVVNHSILIRVLSIASCLNLGLMSTTSSGNY